MASKKAAKVAPKKVKVLPPGTTVKANLERAQARLKKLKGVGKNLSEIRMATFSIQTGLQEIVNEQETIVKAIKEKKPIVKHKSGEAVNID